MDEFSSGQWPRCNDIFSFLNIEEIRIFIPDKILSVVAWRLGILTET